jgi:hypothetical protein
MDAFVWQLLVLFATAWKWSTRALQFFREEESVIDAIHITVQRRSFLRLTRRVNRRWTCGLRCCQAFTNMEARSNRSSFVFFLFTGFTQCLPDLGLTRRKPRNGRMISTINDFQGPL